MSKHIGLEMIYFVLTPCKTNNYGKASRKALLVYAKAIKKENPLLSTQLITWVANIKEEAK